MRYLRPISKIMILGVLSLGLSVVGTLGSVRAGENSLMTGIQAERDGNSAAAEAAYENCIRSAGESGDEKLAAPAFHRLAVLKAKQGRHDDSERLFRQAIHRDGQNVTLLCDFAKLFSDQKKYREAETVLKNAVLAAPDNRRALFNLGHAIASQPDRQTEGLRYLKLALSESLAYKELAKISRAAGNESQADFALQRAEVIGRTETQPTSEMLKSPTVPMDEKTKTEIVEHIKQELLRLEAEEIAEESQKMGVPTEALAGAPVVVPVVTPAVTSAATEPAPNVNDPFLNALSVEPAPPVLSRTPEVVDTKQDVGKINVLPPLTRDAALPTTPSATLPTTLSPLPSFISTKPEPEPRSGPEVAITQELPSPIPVATPAATLEKSDGLRILPEPEYRISNSRDDLASGGAGGEISPLPALVLPLEDRPKPTSLPEYTAIKRIPATKTEMPRPEPTAKFTTAAPKSTADERASKINISPGAVSASAKPDRELAESQDKVPSHPPTLAQPVNLISMDSGPKSSPIAPVTPLCRVDLPALERRSEPGPSKRLPHKADLSDLDVIGGTSPEPAVQELSRSSTSRSILRPGAGKNWNRELEDDYVYVDYSPADDYEPAEADVQKPEVADREKPRIISELKNDTGPDRAFKRTPAIESARVEIAMPMPTKIEDARHESDRPVIVEAVVMEGAAPRNSLPAIVEPPPLDRSGPQFSSNRAPNVLKFEIAGQEEAEPLPEPEPVRETAFNPPRVLNFSPSKETPTTIRHIDSPVQAANPAAPLATESKPVHEENAMVVETAPPAPVAVHDPFLPNFPIVKQEPKQEPKPVHEEIAASKPAGVTFLPIANETRRTEPIPVTEDRPVEVAVQKTVPKETARFSTAPKRPEPERRIEPPVAVQEIASVRPVFPAENPMRGPRFEPEPEPKPAAPAPVSVLAKTEPVYAKPVDVRPDPTLQEISRQFAATPVYEKIEERRTPPKPSREIAAVPVPMSVAAMPVTPPTTDDSIGFARTRRSVAPPSVEVATTAPRIEKDIEAMIAPQDQVLDSTAFSALEDEPEAGFARSGRYSEPGMK